MTNTISTRWNRCTTACGCPDVNVSVGCKTTANGKACGGCERGAADRAQRDAYALDVLRMMGLWDGVSTHAICPLTGKAFDLAVGQVDKAVEAAGYVQGNVCMVSMQGNQERAKMQQHYDDMAGVARYIVDVAAAATGAMVLRKCDVPAYPTVKRFKACDVREDERPAKDMRNVRFGPYGIA